MNIAKKYSMTEDQLTDIRKLYNLGRKIKSDFPEETSDLAINLFYVMLMANYMPDATAAKRCIMAVALDFEVVNSLIQDLVFESASTQEHPQ